MEDKTIPNSARGPKVVGQAAFDGGRKSRAEIIAETRDDAVAAAWSGFAAGVLVALILVAIFGTHVGECVK